jgi:cytochrome c
MTRTLLALSFSCLGLTLAATANASTELARSKNCMACHAAEKKLIGPSYKDIAAKYVSDKDAVAKLSKKVREGGVGVWGQIPMPATPQVSEDEANTLVKWVLSTREFGADSTACPERVALQRQHLLQSPRGEHSQSMRWR